MARAACRVIPASLIGHDAGMSERVAHTVASNAKRWWRNSAIDVHSAFPIRYFDGLGVPRLAA